MSGIRPELSLGAEYWIERHRYYELKHFCLQYPNWKRDAAYCNGPRVPKIVMSQVPKRRMSGSSDPVHQAAEAREYFLDRIALLERVADMTDPIHGRVILRGVTEGVSYDILMTWLDYTPCSRDMYYKLYRRFFWILDKERM